jgi:hypothetical protein
MMEGSVQRQMKIHFGILKGVFGLLDAYRFQKVYYSHYAWEAKGHNTSYHKIALLQAHIVASKKKTLTKIQHPARM